MLKKFLKKKRLKHNKMSFTFKGCTDLFLSILYLKYSLKYLIFKMLVKVAIIAIAIDRRYYIFRVPQTNQDDSL